MKKLLFLFFTVIPTCILSIEQMAKAWALSQNAQPGDRITCRMFHDPQDDPDFILANCSVPVGNGVITYVFGNDTPGEHWIDLGVAPLDEEEYVFLEERHFDLTNDDVL